MRSQVIAVALGVALFLPVLGAGQHIASDDAALQKELERLGEVAETLQHSLPSLACKENAVSERLDRGKVKEHVAFAATVRAVRVPGGTLKESFTVTEVGGKPFLAGNLKMPYYVSGGFDSAMRYFAPGRQACYRYSASPGRVDFETVADAESRPQCRDDGLRGFALLDREGNVTHLERRVSDHAVVAFQLVPFAAIDFGLVELNGRVFRLARHIIAEASPGRSQGRFEASYSECKLFTATIKIGPASEPVRGEDGPP